jgi:hypothetical protein
MDMTIDQSRKNRRLTEVDHSGTLRNLHSVGRPDFTDPITLGHNHLVP